MQTGQDGDFEEIRALPARSWANQAVGLRVLGILLVLLPLWGAASLVNGLVGQRDAARSAAEADISAKWGNDQALAGPLLMIPWESTKTITSTDDGKTTQHVEVDRHMATFLPAEYKVEGELKPELRRRGIYETVVYDAELVVSGRFDAPDFQALGVTPDQVRAQAAVLNVGISDPRGIREAVALQWGASKLDFQPGAADGSPFDSGIQVRGMRIPEARQSIPFSFTLSLDGSRSFLVTPVGKISHMALHSAWADPSFTGAYLPLERSVGPQGFTAAWSVQQLARNFPGAWSDNNVAAKDFSDSAFGVNLIKTANAYQQNDRASKYALLFLVLTFTFFFMSEALGGAQVHPVQTLFVGAALVVFYLLLLSLSELIGFGGAYLAAASATLGLVGVYARAAFGRAKQAWLLTACLGALYGYLYVVLQLDEYALLMGSLAVFGVLAAVMLSTRRLNWYALDLAGRKTSPGQGD